MNKRREHKIKGFLFRCVEKRLQQFEMHPIRFDLRFGKSSIEYLNVQVSDTTKADSSNADGQQKK